MRGDGTPPPLTHAVRAVYLVISAIVLSCLVAIAQTPRFTDDPLFAIRYDPKLIHFESLPNSLVERCPNLRNRYVAAWVYGHAGNSDTEYFFVSGLMTSSDQKTGRQTGAEHPDGNGLFIAVSVHGAECKMTSQDSFYWNKDHSDPLWNMPESALAADVLQRYAKAFGGKPSFLKKVTHPERLAPIMREQLEIFEKQN